MKTKYFVYLPILLSMSLVACNKEVVPSTVTISNMNNTASSGVHTETQLEVLNSEDPDTLIGSRTVFYGLTSSSKPKPVSFSWKEENDINQDASKYEILISESSDMSNPLKYVTQEQKIDVYNLKINVDYYYQANSIHSSKTFSSEVKSFNVNDVMPRNIYVDGMENVRDLGGWDIGENKTYKQGMIYRTVQFNYGGINTYEHVPTEKGFETLRNELKIKTEIDLRKTTASFGEDEVNGITSSPIGSSVKYVSCPMIYGNENIFTNTKNKSSIQLFFSTLSDINNYPVAFHCLRGTDRTGALAYVLGALVGMNEDDLMLDYLFSDLSDINGLVRKANITGDDFYVQGIANSSGVSYSEKAKNYLMTTCEISESTINQVIDNLTD